MAPRLVSVNIGFPREITWRGKIIRTGIWKSRVVDRVIVRKLNIDGDGQGDLAGHGGVNRAEMVYKWIPTAIGSANLAEMTFRMDNSVKTSPWKACLTLKSVLATVTASAPHYSRYRSRGSRVIASASAWANRKWQR